MVQTQGKLLTPQALLGYICLFLIPLPQEQLRVMSEARQLAGATFRPDLSPSRQREGKCFLVGGGAG